MWRGDREAGDREKRGWEVYGRWEAGEKGKKLCNIVQYFAIKTMQREAEPMNTGRELGLKGMGSRRLNPTVLEMPSVYLQTLHIHSTF